MIEGITILNQTEIMELPGWCKIGICLCILSAIIILIVGIAANDTEVKMSAAIPIMSTLLLLIFGLCDSGGTGRYEYEVTIDESVDFIDIYEKYDVIEQRGEIWVLEDKEK